MYVGECACGDLIMELDGEPSVNGICHCNNCKRRTGSAYGVSAWFDVDDIGLIIGETVTYSFNGELGRQERRFCARCGATLAATASEPEDGTPRADGADEGDAAAS